MFALYLGLQLLALPLIAGVAWALTGRTADDWTSEAAHWFSVASIFVTFLSVTGYAWHLQRRHRILPSGIRSPLVAFVTGALCWFIAFPLVAMVQFAVVTAMALFIDVPLQEQVAVTHLRNTASDPWLALLMLLAIVILVPILEELLFRGFLQSWLTQRWNVRRAILGSSALFTLFHFSMDQGWSNLPILSALFVLALILGLLFHRFRSLWAPIGLHCAFNAVTAWQIMTSLTRV